MKTFNKIFLTFFAFACYNTAFAQNPQTGCIDAAIQAQADGVKLGLSKKGMVVFQEGMFHMTSLEPVPVVVKLTQGVSYELIFVGSESTSKMMMELYDGKDKKIDEKIERSTNTIIYSFTPAKTDAYLVTLTQKKALKDMCGYFAVMMKGTPRAVAPKNNVKDTPPVKPSTVKTNTPPSQSTKINTSKTNTAQRLPANQRPNPNRTKATREAQQERNK